MKEGTERERKDFIGKTIDENRTGGHLQRCGVSNLEPGELMR